MGGKNKEALENNDRIIANELGEQIESLQKLKKDEIIEITLTQRDIIQERQGEISELNKRIAECDSKVSDLTMLLKRVQADFDNHRRRGSESIRTARAEGAAEVIERFIPSLDIIDQALLMIKDEQVASGIRMMRRNLMEIFTANNVTEIDALDTVFDPNLHEAVLSEENSEKSGKVLEVLRKGYKMGDKVIRYAAVKVAK